MITILEHIDYLLLEQDCVIIPKFGAILVEHIPATFSEENGAIVPPTCSVVFSQQISHDDDTLADFIAQINGISFDQAVGLINEDVQELKHLLEQGQIVTVNNLGALKMTDGTVEFLPLESEVMSHEYTGLQGLTIPTLSELSASISDDNAEKVVEVPFAKKALRYASVVITLIGLTILGTTPVVLDESNSDFASLSFVRKQERLAKDIQTFRGKLAIAKPSDKDAMTEVDARYPHFNSVFTRVEDAQDQYYLVIAALANRNMAEKFISLCCDEIKPQLRILDKGNSKTYKVYISSSNDLNSLKSKMTSDELSSVVSSAWICNKNQLL